MPAPKNAPRLRDYDELFGLPPTAGDATQGYPTASTGEVIVPFDLMDDFPGHPFHLYSGERESDMTESIRANGILQPLILRLMDSGRHQILSGHNRKHAGIKAGLTEAPAVVKRGLTDDEAWVYVIETNLMQRSFADMAHSEKAAVIAAHHSKLFSQGKRNDILEELQMLENPHEHRADATCAQVAHKLKSREKVAKEYSLSKDTVARYLRINHLIPTLKARLDSGDIAFIPGVTLSFLKEGEQNILEKCIGLNGFKVDMKKANLLRDHSEKGKLDMDSAYLILAGEIGQIDRRDRAPSVKFSRAVYLRYFRPGQTVKEVQGIVEKALEMYFQKAGGAQQGG